MVENEELLLALLNSTPSLRGVQTDELEEAGSAFARRFGGTGSPRQLRHLRSVRGTLQRLIREEETSSREALDELLGDAVLTPRATSRGIEWDLRTGRDEELGVQAIIAWSEVLARLPGRLRECANSDCTLFLIDHSRPGNGRWCSMATCGNRMKVRAHADRRDRSTDFPKGSR